MGIEAWEKREQREHTGGGKRKRGKQDSESDGTRKRREKNYTTLDNIFNPKNAQRRALTKKGGTKSGLKSTGSGKFGILLSQFAIDYDCHPV